MIDIVIIIILTYMAFRIISIVRQEADIFREFNQSQSIGWLSLLFPLGPIVYFVLALKVGWLLAIILSIICYLPGLIAARKRITTFETAGTDRVQKAQGAASQASAAAVVGLVYSGFKLTMVFIGNAFA